MTKPHAIGNGREQRILEAADSIWFYLYSQETEHFLDWAQETQATLDDARNHVLWHAAALEWELHPAGHPSPERHFLWCLRQWMQPDQTYELHPSLQLHD